MFLLTLLVLSLIVAVHEFGHFLLAKKFGVSCPIFSIGFGPRLFGFKIRETDFRLSLFPLGGYVRMKGFVGEPESLGHSDSYTSKTRWQRFIIVAAGPMFNFISAFIGTVIVFSLIGVPEGTNTVSEVTVANSEYRKEPPIQANDTIISVNGTPTHNYREIVKNLETIVDQPKKLGVIRNGREIEVVLDPGRNLSIAYTTKNKKMNLIDSGLRGFTTVTSAIGLQINGVADIITNKIDAKENLSGPVGIISAGSDLNQQMGWLAGSALFAFFISIALGVMNLLPIPILDGGHMFILAIEMIMRRDLSPKFKNTINGIGLILLLGLFIFVTFNDLSR